MIYFKEYTLEDIANWNAEDSKVKIPALQRGLVWSPKQVEFLWDSLLRGFPIGNFIFSESISNEKGDDKEFDLMDGQQRFNSIFLGYNNSPKNILWLDLAPTNDPNSTRKFFVKVTTEAHPWGYKNDDLCSRLNVSDKRTALKYFGLNDKNIYNDEINLEDTWPLFSGLPIPLSYFLHARTCDENKFYEDVICTINRNTNIKVFNFKDNNETIHSEEIKRTIKSLYPVFSNLREYKICCTVLPLEVLDNASKKEDFKESNTTSLEILFNRLNTGGTAISKMDLRYSAIKAYWPNIKAENDRLAEKYLDPSELIMLVFRLALTTDESVYFKEALSIKEIRDLSSDVEKKKKIENIYQKLGGILECIDTWLGVTNSSRQECTPTFIRTSIARKSPDVYLLLMYFGLKGIDIDGKIIKALAFILHWFYGNNKKEAVKTIFSFCKEEISLDNIKKGISQAQHDRNILPIYSPRFIKRDYEKYNGGEKWIQHEKWKISNLSNFEAYRQLFDRICWYGSAEAKEMLIFSEREFFYNHFKKYDPARRDLWETYNRPWDYDHIIPQEWVKNRKQEYQKFCKTWLWSIGNMAAIPFEKNRQKNDKSEFKFYEDKENCDSLSFDAGFVNIKKGQLTKVWEASNSFAQIVFNRMLKIYQSTYECINILVEEPILSDHLQERKNFMLGIKESLTDSKVYFATDNYEEYEVNELDWSREWIGVGVVIQDLYACFEWKTNQDDSLKYKNIEIGIRRGIKKPMSNDKRNHFEKNIGSEDLKNYFVYPDNPWWYICRQVKEKPDVSLVVKELEKLIENIKNTDRKK